MKIGLIDLDTSHPAAWIPIERELGHDVIGVWDGGSIHPRGYAEKFAAEQKIPRVYATLEEMAKDVDCAILHGCDWDTHVEKARPFIEHGRSVLIDKPIAGNARDLAMLENEAKRGARITGGSSLRFCVEVSSWLAKPVDQRGSPETVFCGCGVDEFNYGIHAYSMMCGLMGPGIRSVRHLSKGGQRRLEVKWVDGRTGFLTIGAAKAYLPFYATVVTEKGVSHLQADNGKLYRAMLEAVLPYLAKKTDAPPVSFSALIEAERCAVAARRSWMERDREVKLSDLGDSRDGYDGKAFAAEYRKSKYP
jgi:predicted dehydrogenase